MSYLRSTGPATTSTRSTRSTTSFQFDDQVIPMTWADVPAQTKALQPPPHGDVRDGVMIALFPDEATAKDLALAGGTPPEELHVTVAYAGKAADVDAAALTEAARSVAARGPITGELSGLARFTGGDEDGDVLVALYDSADLEALRRDLVDALRAAGIDLPGPHGFTAHLTLGYLAPGDAAPLTRLESHPLNFSEVVVVHGQDREPIPFTETPETEPAEEPATEVAEPAPPPDGLQAKGKSPIGGKGTDAGPKIATGAFVSLGERKGRVDMVVTSGTVPGATGPDDEPVEGSAQAPAARVVEYEPAGDGTFKATGKKFASSLARLARTAPLRTHQTKSLSEALSWAQVGHGFAEEERVAPALDTLRAVYERGVKAWPGAQVTALTEQQWALGRVDAFVAKANGLDLPAYRGDDDLLPGAGEAD